MKQYISIEQLQELSPEAKERLCEWWKPQPGDNVYWKSQEEVGFIEYENAAGFYVNCRYVVGYVAKSDMLPIFSIGMCIDFLQSKQIKTINITINIPETELIDALWEKIKAELP